MEDEKNKPQTRHTNVDKDHLVEARPKQKKKKKKTKKPSHGQKVIEETTESTWTSTGPEDNKYVDSISSPEETHDPPDSDGEVAKTTKKKKTTTTTSPDMERTFESSKRKKKKKSKKSSKRVDEDPFSKTNAQESRQVTNRSNPTSSSGRASIHRQGFSKKDSDDYKRPASKTTASKKQSHQDHFNDD